MDHGAVASDPARRHRPSPGRTPTAALLLAVVTAMLATCGGSSPSPGGSGSLPATTTVAGPTSGAAGRSAFGPPVLLGEITDERVTESSGLVASRRHPGRLWTHNDSDNPPVLVCVEPDGGPCGGWTVDGAANVDWEDIAAGPGPVAGEHYLYVGDVGDNTVSRDDVVVYRVVEPTVPAPAGPGTTGGADGVTAPATALRLRYDDGPHDAESLMVHPTTGDLYVITKAIGDTRVYKARPEGGVLTRVGALGLGLLGFATGADISPDGRRVAVSTLVGGFELTLDGGSGFDAVWARPPAAVTLPGRVQGESIAYRLDGDALLVTSEGYPSPLHAVPRL